MEIQEAIEKFEKEAEHWMTLSAQNNTQCIEHCLNMHKDLMQIAFWLKDYEKKTDALYRIIAYLQECLENDELTAEMRFAITTIYKFAKEMTK